jgi:hypothetical protein
MPFQPEIATPKHYVFHSCSGRLNGLKALKDTEKHAQRQPAAWVILAASKSNPFTPALLRLQR